MFTNFTRCNCFLQVWKNLFIVVKIRSRAKLTCIFVSLYGDCHELLALLKEQMIIAVQKTLNNAGHIDAKLIHFLKFAEKNPAKSSIFYWLFLSEVSPWNFPWKRPIFLTICPWKSFEIWLFSAKIPRNRPIFLRILT